jgi:hypothetical protein
MTVQPYCRLFSAFVEEIINPCSHLLPPFLS